MADDQIREVIAIEEVVDASSAERAVQINNQLNESIRQIGPTAAAAFQQQELFYRELASTSGFVPPGGRFSGQTDLPNSFGGAQQRPSAQAATDLIRTQIALEEELTQVSIAGASARQSVNARLRTDTSSATDLIRTQIALEEELAQISIVGANARMRVTSPTPPPQTIPAYGSGAYFNAPPDIRASIDEAWRRDHPLPPPTSGGGIPPRVPTATTNAAFDSPENQANLAAYRAQVKQAADANDGATKSFLNMSREGRAAMLIMMGTNLVLQEMSLITGGKVTPEIRALGDAMRSVGDAMFASTLLGKGMGPGLLIGGLTAGIGLLMDVPPAYKAVNLEIDKLVASSNELKTEGDLTGWTNDQVTAMNKLAKADENVANAMATVIRTNELAKMSQSGQFPQQQQAVFQLGLEYNTSPEHDFFSTPAEDSANFQKFIARKTQEYQYASDFLQKQQANLEALTPYKGLMGAAQKVEASPAFELSAASGFTEEYSKKVIQAAQADDVFGRTFSELIPRIVAYKASIADLTARGMDATAANRALAGEVNNLASAYEAAAARMQKLVLPSLRADFSVKNVQDLNKEKAIADALAQSYIAQLSHLENGAELIQKQNDEWAKAREFILMADGSMQLVVGREAALLGLAQQVTAEKMKQANINVQADSSMTVARAAQLQNLLRRFEASLTAQGVQQNPQEYLIYGQGGQIFRLYTSNQALALAMNELRGLLSIGNADIKLGNAVAKDNLANVQDNTKALKDAKPKGDYNIPSDYGYKVPVPADFGATRPFKPPDGLSKSELSKWKADQRRDLDLAQKEEANRLRHLDQIGLPGGSAKDMFSTFGKPPDTSAVPGMDVLSEMKRESDLLKQGLPPSGITDPKLGPESIFAAGVNKFDPAVDKFGVFVDKMGNKVTGAVTGDKWWMDPTPTPDTKTQSGFSQGPLGPDFSGNVLPLITDAARAIGNIHWLDLFKALMAFPIGSPAITPPGFPGTLGIPKEQQSYIGQGSSDSGGLGNTPYASMITAAAAANGIPAAALAAIISIESAFKPNSINKASGATGLGQVMPSDAPGYGNTFAGRPTTQQLLDPATNIQWAAKIFADGLKHTGSLEGAASRYFGIGTDAQGTTTSQYVRAFDKALDKFGGHGSQNMGIDPSKPVHVQGVPETNTNLLSIRAQESQLFGATANGFMQLSAQMAISNMLSSGMLNLLSAILVKVGTPPIINILPAGGSGVATGSSGAQSALLSGISRGMASGNAGSMIR